MITTYAIDEQDVFSGAVTHSLFSPAPRGSQTAPPETTGTEVAQLQGDEWVVLPEYPTPPLPVPTPEELRAQAKAARAAAVDAITVTTTAGNTFDGDETSQTRMARAILVLQATSTPSTIWVLADNTVIDATAAELTEALALAGAAQAALWVIP